MEAPAAEEEVVAVVVVLSSVATGRLSLLMLVRGGGGGRSKVFYGRGGVSVCVLKSLYDRIFVLVRR